MKSFIKKFSFVLAAAMVLTSVAVPASAEAATKGEVTVKGSAVSSKTVWAGGKSVNFDYKYGKKTSGIKGVWTSNNANIVVNPTSGKVTATGKADGTVTFTPDSKKYKKITVAVKARVRATGLFVREDDKNGQVVSEASVKVGETKKFYVSMSTKLHVKSTYFTHVSASTTAASVTNGANGTSYAGANYGRELTVTGLATGTSVINVSATPYTDDRTSNYDPTPVTLTVKVGETKVDNAFEQGAKQTGAKQITATGLATTAGVFLTSDSNPNTIIRVEKTTVNSDSVVYDLVDRLVPNAKYSLKDTTGKVVASFVAEGERAADLVINDGLKIASTDSKTAIGSFYVTNQWGQKYTGEGFTGNLAYTFLDDQGLAINDGSIYTSKRDEAGVVYFTVAQKTSDGTNTFRNGDVKHISIVATGLQYTKTASKYLVVDGTETVSNYALFDNNFTKAAKVIKSNEELTSLKDANGLAWNFYLAFPAGTKAEDENTGSYAVYLVNGSTKKNITDKLSAVSYADVLQNNDKDGKNNEAVYSVDLSKIALAKDTTYSIEVVYNGKTGSTSLTSKSFKLKEENKIDTSKVNVTVDSKTCTLDPAGVASATAITFVTKLDTLVKGADKTGYKDEKVEDKTIVTVKATYDGAGNVVVNSVESTDPTFAKYWTVKKNTAGNGVTITSTHADKGKLAADITAAIDGNEITVKSTDLKATQGIAANQTVTIRAASEAAGNPVALADDPVKPIDDQTNTHTFEIKGVDGKVIRTLTFTDDSKKVTKATSNNAADVIGATGEGTITVTFQSDVLVNKAATAGTSGNKGVVTATFTAGTGEIAFKYAE